ncbi:MAG: bifunctional phosphoribosylaminoimidazolecarboxamide formyltransferase/IMP cyclohydrolase PurH [Flavobacteriia bacterium]|nr:bifunctional phosphoribosylaminoimidazolecarboxamide formyltransferase/IMP cyclohydrolase PurH [Flavobacteriia bacterium]
MKKIHSALLSVYNKEGLAELAQALINKGVVIYSTGGTLTHLKEIGIPTVPVEELTQFPEILGGRVKTLHPVIFGGILFQRDLPTDKETVTQHNIPPIDLVVVDLYPFEETVKQTQDAKEIIEKIDIGGISLIRAAAKNHNDVAVLSSKSQYSSFLENFGNQEGALNADQRKQLAAAAFSVSSGYDSAIQNYLHTGEISSLSIHNANKHTLRYGENPHQQGFFFGDLAGFFDKLSGKELSYNNLLDVDSAVHLMSDFNKSKCTFAILKHNNACGIAIADSVAKAYSLALAADPVSAFGGVLIANASIDLDTATLLNDLFFEILIAPEFDSEAIELLTQKKNRILLKQLTFSFPNKKVRSALNGFLLQDSDEKCVGVNDITVRTNSAPSPVELEDLIFANKVVKHTKSNGIALVKNNQLLACGTGQTSRVDALQQAIHKAKSFGFNLAGAVMASDAFFPFPDCAEIAHQAGITAIIQPGGSIKDQLSIDYCNTHDLKMVFSGFRHFKH